MMQVAVMSSDARTAVRDVCMLRLVLREGGDLFGAELAAAPRLYYAGECPWTLHDLHWRTTTIPRGAPYVPQFWRVILDADPACDLLFLEDDVWIVTDGIRKIAALAVPDWAGVVTLFDWHDEAKSRQGFVRLPWGHIFMGAQALKFPARVIADLQKIARAEVYFIDPRSTRPEHLATDPRWRTPRDRAVNSWDNWVGRAVEALGLEIALYAPSMVQHLGNNYSAIFPHHHHGPIASNFPEEWPRIAIPEIDERYWCSFHGTWHTEPTTCPRRA